VMEGRLGWEKILPDEGWTKIEQVRFGKDLT
jgi:hypothetical protein